MEIIGGGEGSSILSLNAVFHKDIPHFYFFAIFVR